MSERFQRMVLIEAIVRGVDVNGAVAAKVSMLNKRKASDPTVNFAIVKNPKNGEIILDFILSAQDPDQRPRHLRAASCSADGLDGIGNGVG